MWSAVVAKWWMVGQLPAGLLAADCSLRSELFGGMVRSSGGVR